MPKRASSKIPSGAMIVRTYAHLLSEVDAFAYGERNLLVIIGPAGTLKSTAVRSRLVNPRIIQGGARPYRLFMELYEHQDKDIVLDDADNVFRDKEGGVFVEPDRPWSGVRGGVATNSTGWGGRSCLALPRQTGTSVPTYFGRYTATNFALVRLRSTNCQS